MRTYKLYVRVGRAEADAAMTVNEDGSTTSFIFDPDNTDYQDYLKWLEEGGVVLPADKEVK